MSFDTQHAVPRRFGGKWGKKYIKIIYNIIFVEGHSAAPRVRVVRGGGGDGGGAGVLDGDRRHVAPH